MIRARAIFPFPTSRGNPVPGSGMSASSGTETSPAMATAVAVARFATQVALPGAGSIAGSPSAAQISRPAGSRKPPTGFHAAAGFAAMPRRSQPFHGKSLSLTVRTKMAELNPA